LTVDFLINIFLNIVRKQKRKTVQKRRTKSTFMAMDQLTKLMIDQFVVVLNNFHMNYEIVYLRLDIDDDDDNQWMTYKHYMLMDQMLKMDLLLMLFLIELDR
jgi:hypothetical protein